MRVCPDVDTPGWCFLRPWPCAHHQTQHGRAKGTAESLQHGRLLGLFSSHLKPQLISYFWKDPARVGKVSGGGRGGVGGLGLSPGDHRRNFGWRVGGTGEELLHHAPMSRE